MDFPPGFNTEEYVIFSVLFIELLLRFCLKRGLQRLKKKVHNKANHFLHLNMSRENREIRWDSLGKVL